MRFGCHNRVRHTGESQYPEPLAPCRSPWIPAFAGMTERAARATQFDASPRPKLEAGYIKPHVAQQFRPSVPHHHLGRKPRAGDRLRGRWLPARHPDHRGRDPGLSRQAQAGPIALHHPAQRAGPGAHPLRRVHATRTATQLTTGTPIALEIANVDARSKDYGEIKDKFRPGHADYTYQMKYGLRDWRGSGRASARETATASPPAPSRGKSCRACACAARSPRSALTRSTAATGIGTRSATTRSSVPTPRRRGFWAEFLDQVRKQGSSAGAVIEVVAEGVPPGLGAPIYGKLDQDIASG